jgi:hypothetical protein
MKLYEISIETGLTARKLLQVCNIQPVQRRPHRYADELLMGVFFSLGLGSETKTRTSEGTQMVFFFMD